MILKNFYLDYIAENKVKFVLFILIVFILFPLESVYLPTVYGKLFTSKIGKRYSIWDKNSAFRYVIYIILVWLLLVGLHSGKHYLESKIVPNYLSYLRQTIFSRTIDNHEDNYKDIKAGKHLTRILDVSREMKDVLMYSLADLVPLIITTVVINIYFVYVNRKIGYVSLVGLLVLFLVSGYFGMSVVEASKNREQYYLKMSERLNDSFTNLMNVYVNNETGKEINKNKEVDDKYKSYYLKQLNLTSKMILFLSIISVFLFGVIILISFNEVRNGRIKKSVFISLMIIIIYYLGFMMSLSNHLPNYLTRIGSIHNSTSFLMNIMYPKKERTIELSNVRGAIRYENIGFKYPGSDKYLFRNIDLSISAGDKVAVVGRSGIGKTTMMKLLLGMYKTVDGSIYIDGVDISNVMVKSLRRNVVYVNQRTQLFNDTVMNNIRYGNDALNDDIIGIMSKYNLGDIYSGLESGVNTVAGVQGGNLSLGMQKVTILLRGILKMRRDNGMVVLFDEPLAGLDTKTRKKVINMIMGECKGKTLIVITHDKEILPYMNKVIDFGKMISSR